MPAQLCSSVVAMVILFTAYKQKPFLFRDDHCSWFPASLEKLTNQYLLPGDAE